MSQKKVEDLEEINDKMKLTNVQKRKDVYRNFTRVKQGYFGRGVRKLSENCVYDLIGRHFQPTEGYTRMGFKISYVINIYNS